MLRAEAVAEVVEHFRGGDRNFLTPAAGPLGPDTILDISHESLIRQWVNLDGWAKEEAKSAETYRLLEKTAAEWSEPWTGTNLDRVLEWKRTQKPNAAWAARYGGDFVRAMNFIEVGLEQRKKQERDKEAARRREEQVRRFKAVAVAALVGSVVAVSLAAYAWRQRAQANENAAVAEDARKKSEASEKLAMDESENAKKYAETAERNRDEALKQTAHTNSLILASKAQNLAERYPVRSILLASQAIQTARGEEKGALLNVEAENVLRRTLGTISGIGLGGIGGNFRTVAYSPDGKTLAAGYGDGGDGGVVLFDARGERLDPRRWRSRRALSRAWPSGRWWA